ncbi:cyclophilin-like fold protein [Dyadobacter sp. CY356]|uniref:cyclophilin-like fold protein n=1 Tax=Dyadobacter sp. CY356 TaxID=2906442 RepID=UPI001EEF1220|nr:cyclophilin-like fold protein [Dyadobacter sp. CY356]MCF0058817.1 hypothetical protein [Dyadobacter sp. CY356]
MKHALTALFSIIIFIGFMACKTDENITAVKMDEGNNNNVSVETAGTRVNIRIGSKTFLATLMNSPAASAFKTKLPMTVAMSDLNGNEKFFNLPANLPVNASSPGSIHTGDLMIYGSNTLVLFYKSFTTQYSYTRLGRIEDVSGLATAVGSGNVTVTFTLQ